jgi:TetR/AcrR family transcriptional regulator, transcriptional repressor for nem operon
MKVSRQQAAENRERVLAAASQLFRERGFEGIGVADLMKAAGQTHGAFYGQFDSKDHLIAQACSRAFADSRERHDRLLEGKKGREGLEALLSSYLSPRHVAEPGSGCALAALAPEAARRDRSVKKAFTEGVMSLAARIEGFLPGRDPAARRKKALSTLASMVGALVLARAVDDASLAKELLEAVRQS